MTPMYIILMYVICVIFRATGTVDQCESTCARKLPPALSRHPSVTVNYTEHGAQLEDNTFEHILQETAPHDTVMAFYYVDENNKVQAFSEVFVIKNSESTHSFLRFHLQ